MYVKLWYIMYVKLCRKGGRLTLHQIMTCSHLWTDCVSKWCEVIVVYLLLNCWYHCYGIYRIAGIKFGSLAVCLSNHQIKNLPKSLVRIYICMVIPYWTAKFKSANTFCSDSLGHNRHRGWLSLGLRLGHGRQRLYMRNLGLPLMIFMALARVCKLCT